jgi:hypothetical protein
MNKQILQKVKYFLERLSSKPNIGGLLITDASIQYLSIEAGSIKPYTIKLPYGVIRGGRVIDEQKFREALTQLHDALTKDQRVIIPVTVILPSSGIYTQSFNVPNIGLDKLKEAAGLNIQMISPMSPDHAYMTWQVVRETQDQFELLGAFAEKAFVDGIRQTLELTHFSPIVLEFSSLALTRLIELANITGERPAILISISSDGMNLSIIKNKALYFDYFRSWASIQGDKKEITKDYFESIVGEELQKVINFCVSKFKDAPERIFLVTPGFEEGMQTYIKTHFALPTVLFSIPSWNISSSWYAAIGAALRENASYKFGDPINFAPITSGDFFLQEQTIRFIRLWRGVTVAVLGIIFILFAGGAYILGNELLKTKNHLAIFTANLPQKELAQLEGNVSLFNALVKNVGDVELSKKPWPEFFDRLEKITTSQNIIVDKIEAGTFDEPISMIAHGSDTNSIVDFKNTLIKEKDFDNVDLLVSQIASREDGTVGFQISFKYIPQTKKPS